MTYGILKLFALFSVLALVFYCITPKKYRHIALLVASLICVGYYSRVGIVYLLVTILTTYGAGLIMELINEKHITKGLEKAERKKIKALCKSRKKMVVFGYVFVNIGILFFLKYFKMFFPTADIPLFMKIAMPLGISYYTLQSLSYVIDVFRGKFKAERDIFKVALFIGYLPQLHEGPFGRYDVYINDMCKNEPLKWNNIYNGCSTILWGIFKIFMVANRASMIADNVFAHKEYGGTTILLGGIAFTLQLYAEFSGYIDLAKGISEIFGINLARNFDMPFIARDVSDFWRRWHISLGEWFRDYVFYPVSTAKIFRKAPDFVTINCALLCVWFLTGLWHGASWKYVVYGLYYFVLMVILNLVTPLFARLCRQFNINGENTGFTIAKIILTQFLVVVGMIMFRAENLTVFKDMMISMVHGGTAINLLTVIDIKELVVLIASVLVLLVTAGLKLKGVSLRDRYNEMSSTKKYLVCFSALCFMIIFGAYGLDYIPPDPIYGGF